MSALRLINETTAVSGVSSINIDNIFSSDFDIYKITYNSEATAGNIADINLRVINSSGSVIASSIYDYAYLRMQYAGAFSEDKNTGLTSARLFGVNYDSPEGARGVAYVFNPYSSSSYTFFIAQNNNIWNNENSKESRKNIAVAKTTVSCTGLQIIIGTGGFSTNTVFRTYGLRVDNG